VATTTTNHPSLLRTFWANALLAPRTSLGFMRIDFILGTIFIIPLTQMAFFAFVANLTSDPATTIPYVVVGNAVATVTYSSVFSVCQTTDSEKQQGTMEHLLVSPANRLAMFLGRGVIPILISIATASVALTYAVVIFHVPFDPAGLPFLAISILLTAFSMVGFGLMLGGVALYLRTSIILGNIFLFVGLLLSGANFPLDQLPLPAQWAGDLLPLTWGIAAIRDAMVGQGLGTLWLPWTFVTLGGIVSITLALTLWRVFERRALSTGSIARF
jgi:ABC-2 type transport system permease protein